MATLTDTQENQLKRNSAYWQRRFAAQRAADDKAMAAYLKQLEDVFSRVERDLTKDMMYWLGRFAGNNGGKLTFAAMKKMLDAKELAEFKWDVKDYIKYGKENALTGQWMTQLENASARVHISRYDAMRLQIQGHIQELRYEYDKKTQGFLGTSYEQDYYRTIYDVQQGTGIGTTFGKLSENKISAVLRDPWAADGKNFSQRIWGNAGKLNAELNQQLTYSLIRGDDPQKTINHLSERFGVSKRQAGRLVMTEQAAFASKAAQAAYKSQYVEQYQIDATLDTRTSQTCQAMDQQVFDLKDFEVGRTAPPFHPNCRTVTAPYDALWEGLDEPKRIARGEDGQTYTVPDMSYGEWKSWIRLRELKKELAQLEKDLQTDTSSDFFAKYLRKQELEQQIDDLQDATNNGNIYVWDTWKVQSIQNDADADCIAVNPNYSVGREYQINCQRTVPTYEMRRRGYDVVAKPIAQDAMGSILWNAFVNKNIEFISGIREAKKNMLNWGNGARAAVRIAWRGRRGGAHFFVAENRNGTIHFLDPQNGNLDASNYFKKSNKKPGHLWMLRMDNNTPTDLIALCCEER
jgi:SPP1 gp7 family putative phage head morphogenesis protein